MYRRLIIILCMVMVFGGCEKSNSEKNTPDPSEKNMQDISSDVSNNDKIKYSLGNKYFLKEVYALTSQEFENAAIEGNLSDCFSENDSWYIANIDNNGLFYIIMPGDEDDGAKWGIYNPFLKEYKNYINLPIGHQTIYVVASDEYVVWLEDESNFAYANLQLHLFDRKSNSDKIIHTYLVNPESNIVYGVSYFEPLILDHKIYFEEYDENSSNILCYDISNELTDIVKYEAKSPMMFNNNLAFLVPGKAQNQSSVHVLENGYETSVFDIDTNLTSMCSAYGDSFVLWNGLTEEWIRNFIPNFKEDDGTRLNYDYVPVMGYSIALKNELREDDTLLFSILDWVDWPRSNDNFVVWRDSNVTENSLFFYSKRLNKIIKIISENINDEYVDAYISNNFIIFDGTTSKNYVLLDLYKLSSYIY